MKNKNGTFTLIHLIKDIIYIVAKVDGTIKHNFKFK